MVELLVHSTGFTSKQHGSSFPFTAKHSGPFISLYSFGESVQVLQDYHREAARELARAFQVSEQHIPAAHRAEARPLACGRCLHSCGAHSVRVHACMSHAARCVPKSHVGRDSAHHSLHDSGCRTSCYPNPNHANVAAGRHIVQILQDGARRHYVNVSCVMAIEHSARSPALLCYQNPHACWYA